MQRLDKFLCDHKEGTRKQVSGLIRNGAVTVNGEIVKDPSSHVDELADQIALMGRLISGGGLQYYLLHKPAGVITATEDRHQETVLDLMEDVRLKGLAPVGRLDKDTEGLLLITNDGVLAHTLLSPSRHVDKTYEATLDRELTDAELDSLSLGVDIGDEDQTLPAIASRLEPDEQGRPRISLTLHEGRFHQVKRMAEAVGAEVLYLKRTRFGSLTLPEDLPAGDYRPLTDAELEALKAEGGKDKLPKAEETGAVIFDLDGSLMDSMWMWKAIDIEYLANHQLTPPPGLQRLIEGYSFYEVAVYFKETFHLEESLEEIGDEWNRMAMDKYRHEVPLKPGAAEFLQICRERGIKLGIASSNSMELISAVLDAHGIRDLFGCVLSGSDRHIKGKPAPDIYLEAARQLGADPKACLVFEDIPLGILAARRAGMTVAAVEDAYSAPQQAVKRELSNLYINDYHELCACWKASGKESV